MYYLVAGIQEHEFFLKNKVLVIFVKVSRKKITRFALEPHKLHVLP